MSRLVQRCLGCRAVRGVSSYRVNRESGGRVAICRWCEDQTESDRLYAKHLHRKELRPLLRAQSSLVAKLARVRTQIRAMECELLHLHRSA